MMAASRPIEVSVRSKLYCSLYGVHRVYDSAVCHPVPCLGRPQGQEHLEARCLWMESSSAAGASAAVATAEGTQFDDLLRTSQRRRVLCPVRRYLGGGATETADPIGWWDQRRSEYSWLAQVAITRLIRLPTSTACERSFSQGRRQSTHLRGRLNAHSLAALVRVGEACVDPDFMPTP